jgi:hypothetical protein
MMKTRIPICQFIARHSQRRMRGIFAESRFHDFRSSAGAIYSDAAPPPRGRGFSCGCEATKMSHLRCWPSDAGSWPSWMRCYRRFRSCVRGRIMETGFTGLTWPTPHVAVTRLHPANPVRPVDFPRRQAARTHQWTPCSALLNRALTATSPYGIRDGAVRWLILNSGSCR